MAKKKTPKPKQKPNPLYDQLRGGNGPKGNAPKTSSKRPAEQPIDRTADVAEFIRGGRRDNEFLAKAPKSHEKNPTDVFIQGVITGGKAGAPADEVAYLEALQEEPKYPKRRTKPKEYKASHEGMRTEKDTERSLRQGPTEDGIEITPEGFLGPDEPSI